MGHEWDFRPLRQGFAVGGVAETLAGWRAHSAPLGPGPFVATSSSDGPQAPGLECSISED